MIWVLLTRLLYFLLLLWCKVLDAYYMMMILGESVISWVDDCASEWYQKKGGGGKKVSDTFVGIPLSVVGVRGPVALAVTLLGKETPRHPPPSSIFPPINCWCKQGPTAKGLVQGLPDGFGLLMKIFLSSFPSSVLWNSGNIGFSPFVVRPHFQIQSAPPPYNF